MYNRKDLLTEQELVILGLITEGKSNIEILEELGFDEKILESHIAVLLKKLNVEDNLHAAIKAINEGWFKDDL